LEGWIMAQDQDGSSGQGEAGLAGRPAPRLRQAERRQTELRAMSLDELISDDHLARLVWQVVGRFDLAPLLDKVVAREGVAGHPQTDPKILVSLWLYATLDGVGSARALARLCTQHHAYQWLCGGVSINYHTLSDFRVAHADWLDRELARSLAGSRGCRRRFVPPGAAAEGVARPGARPGGSVEGGGAGRSGGTEQASPGRPGPRGEGTAGAGASGAGGAGGGAGAQAAQQG
jgi:transposase